MTYDQLVRMSKDLVSKAKIRNAISNKIQYLFVDEYQDTYKWQHEIFLAIYKCKRTDFFVVGDPNQSIYGFSYGTSENNAVRPKSYEEFPICQVKKIGDFYEEKIINYRSSKEIVDLANTFNKTFQQISDMGKFTPVRAIEASCPQIIYGLFHSIRKELNLDGTVFYLSLNNRNLLPYKAKNSTVIGTSCIRSVEAGVSQCVGMSIKKMCDANMISRLQFRAFSVLVGNDGGIDLPILKKIYLNKFGRELICLQQELGEVKPIVESLEANHRAMTVHKSKGLEAESVLLILNSNNHLEKILTKKILMKSTTDDDLRLGYVALTRAKKLLVVACAEVINSKNRASLEKLNVAFL